MIKINEAKAEMKGSSEMLGAEMGVAMLAFLDVIEENEDLNKAKAITVLLNILKDSVEAHVTNFGTMIKHATAIGIEVDELKKQLDEEKESE